ncbi:mitochondrial inner membrane protease ATP23 homolog isoform X2 [Oryctolagus cuniculus]|uniref:mitochondrial inner membrane protease ATP23 homolog isoform X2 n=1 Tax=Oryctolagus cuniculus TaxID=9986 RepID=UPI003879EB92
MAGAPDEREPGPAAGEPVQQPHVAGRVFPERPPEGKPQHRFLSGFLSNNQKCQLMLLRTLEKRVYQEQILRPSWDHRYLGAEQRWEEADPYVKLLLDAMKHSGCAVNTDRHFSCEDCHGHVSGGFDASTSQIVLCQNNIRSEAHMSRVVTHELIHAFDHCRAHVHWFSNVRHLACSETCVRDRAILSILAVRNISKEVAQKAVAEVFESCFNDLEPFGRIPHNKTYARYAHRDFQNRDRYYSNI